LKQFQFDYLACN